MSATLVGGCGDRGDIVSLPSGFLADRVGGVGPEYGTAVAQDRKGNIIIVGHTRSADVTGVTQKSTQPKKDYDVLVLKYEAQTHRLISAETFGGDQDDKATAVAVGDGDRVYIAGTTQSHDLQGAVGTAIPRGKTDVFIAMMNPSLDMVSHSIVLDGDNYDFVRGMAVDIDGSVFIIGTTASSDFPVTSGSFMQERAKPDGGEFNIGADGFIAKFTPDLSKMVAGTLLGGGGDDHLYDIALTGNSEVLVVGNTSSTDFPMTKESFDGTHNWSVDIVVSRLDSGLTKLLSSTYIGGFGYDYGRSIAVNRDGDIYVAGYTASDHHQLPAPSEAVRWRYAGGATDMIIVRLDSTLRTYKGATFLGGSNDDYATAIAIDDDKIFLAGYSASRDFIRGANQSLRHAGGYDIATAVLDMDLSALETSYLIGGKKNDFSYALQIADGRFWIAGNSDSRNFSLHSPRSGTSSDIVSVSLPRAPKRDLSRANDVRHPKHVNH